MIFPFAVASVTRIESKLFSASTFSSAMLVLGLPREDSIDDAISILLEVGKACSSRTWFQISLENSTIV